MSEWSPYARDSEE